MPDSDGLHHPCSDDRAQGYTSAFAIRLSAPRRTDRRARGIPLDSRSRFFRRNRFSTRLPHANSTPAQPPLLSRLLEQQNLTFDDLSFDQLVLVAADGTSCALYAYDRGADGAWVKAFSANGHVGRKGVSANKREGDECTPAGLYALGFAFGHDENPNSDYPFRAIRSDSYWVDDPDSRFYNQWVDGTQDKDWTSAEALGRIRTDYALAVAVEYNYGSSAVPGRGSAIFLHVGSNPTSGCISLPKSDLPALIRWLNADADPHILIASK